MILARSIVYRRGEDRTKLSVKQKNLPEGRKAGLFYLTVLGTVTEDYT